MFHASRRDLTVTPARPRSRRRAVNGSVLSLLLLLVLLPAHAAGFTRTEDVIYGRKHGVALTLDVFKPAAPNGYGAIMVISGGFFSSHEAINAGLFQPTLDRGYTVFAVVHGSQPKYTIPEIVEDLHRAVRFIRHHAAEYGVKPDRLGVMGASAGGHLSLSLAVHGGPGKPDAKDPVDRESSTVAAVACFFPPTDFLNYGQPGEDAVGVGTLKDFKAAFGPRSDTPEGRQSLGREISPIYYVSSNLPPTLILHGDADRLVPIQQAESFVARAKAAGATVQLIVKPGAAHGWPTIPLDLPTLADWFDTHLRGLPAKQAAAP